MEGAALAFASAPSPGLRPPSPRHAPTARGERGHEHGSRESAGLLPFSPAGEKVPEGRMRAWDRGAERAKKKPPVTGRLDSQRL